jgi:glycerate 2-kinase
MTDALVPLERPACAIASGETTVVVRGSGLGGRNQELALAAAAILAGQLRPAAFASAGTDGVDGPTDAAGALADSTTLARASELGLDPASALDENDSHRFFTPLGDLIVTGPTGTNVGDLQVLLVGSETP